MPEEMGRSTDEETASTGDQPSDATRASTAEQVVSHDAEPEVVDEAAESEVTVVGNKKPDKAATDTVDTDTEPLTLEIGQPIRERDTDTATRLPDTHVPESPCGKEGPARRLRSESVTC